MNLNSRDQSIVQVLISMVLMAIVLSVMLTMQSNSAREIRALAEKLAANDLTRVIITTINGPLCGTMLSSGNLVSGNTLTITPSLITVNSPQVINLQTIPSTVPSTPTASLNSQASPLSNSLFIPATGGIQLSVTSATTANLLVNFDQTKLVRTIHNLSFPLIITTNAANAITGCVNPSSPGGGSGSTAPSTLACTCADRLTGATDTFLYGLTFSGNGNATYQGAPIYNPGSPGTAGSGMSGAQPPFTLTPTVLYQNGNLYSAQLVANPSGPGAGVMWSMSCVGLISCPSTIPYP